MIKIVETLKFGNKEYVPNIRKLHDMMKVAYDKEFVIRSENKPVYYYYRGLSKSEDHRKVMEENNIQYDVTFINPEPIGRESAKTKGHYHSIVPNTRLSYPELYQVLEGQALYLLQKKDQDKVSKMQIYLAKPGDIVIIPPNYGHITICTSNNQLKMCNWISTKVQSDYIPIEKKQGGAYYRLADGTLIPNKNYSKVPLAKIRKPDFNNHFGIKTNMYSLIENPKILDFLNKPQMSELF